MKKVIVCLTGVINRSIKYTWDSIKNNIIDQLKKEYEVDIAVFNNNVEDCKVDGVKIIMTCQLFHIILYLNISKHL